MLSVAGAPAARARSETPAGFVGRGKLGRLTPRSAPAQFEGGETIYPQDGPADYIYEVERGVVRTVRLDADGRRIVYGFHTQGDVFGVERNGTHAYSAEAIGDVDVIRCPRELLERAALSDHAVAEALWSWLLSGADRATGRLALLARGSALEKIAHFLIEMAGRAHSEARIELAMSRYDIADYLGLSSETVSRTFTVLREQGLIATEGRVVLLLRPSSLRRLDIGHA